MGIKKAIGEVYRLGLIYSAGSIFQNVIYFILTPIYTAYLSTGDFGVIGLLSVSAGIVLCITKNPVGYGFVRFFYAPGYEAHRKSFLFNSLLFASLKSAIFALIFILFSSFISDNFFGNKLYFDLVIIYAFSIFLQPADNLIQDFVRMEKKAALLTIFQISRVIVVSGLVVLMLAYFDFGVYSLAWGAVFTSAFPILFFLPLILKNMEFKIDSLFFTEVLRYGYPMIAATLFIQLIQSIDQYFIKYFLDISSVGLYSFGYKFGSLMSIILILPFGNIIEPVIFEMESRRYELTNFVRSIAKFFFILGLIIWLGLSLFANELIRLLSSDASFYPAAGIVPAIAFSYLCFGLIFIIIKGLELSGKTKTISMVYLAGLLANLLGNITLIPAYGISGSALSLLISFIVIVLLSYLLSKKHYGFQIEFNKLIIASAIAWIFFIFVEYLPSNSFLISIILKICLFALYIIIIFSIGLITKKDKLLLISIFKN